MTKLIIRIILPLLILSCSIRTRLLENNTTRVPVNSNAYLNRTKFTKDLVKLIDTNAIYEEFSEYYRALSRIDTHNETRIYGAYKFYRDGHLNYFTIDRNEEFSPKILDPLVSGYRGVFYKEGDNLKIDLFTEINQLRKIGKQTHEFLIRGDTLLVKGNFGNVDIYVKRGLPPQYFVFPASW